jgi:hypothetical protein
MDRCSSSCDQSASVLLDHWDETSEPAEAAQLNAISRQAGARPAPVWKEVPGGDCRRAWPCR